MNRRARAWLAALVLAVTTTALYAWRLSEAPIYVSPDEAIISVDAQSLATTGADIHGRFLPLYFQVQLPGETRMGWFTPAIFYLSALVFKVLPFTESAIRVPTVIVAVVDVVLMYLVGRRLFERESSAIVAALLLATSPAHFILGRYALDYLYPLPFVLGWLFCLLTFLDGDKLAWLAAAGAILGIGFFSYIAAVVMMPVYVLVTWASVAHKIRPVRLWACSGAAFAAPLLVLVPWLARHPTAIVDTIDRYGLYDTKSLNAFQGIRSFLGYQSLERLSASYWSFFSPSFLFFSGDKQMTFSTRQTGVFLLPVVVLLLVGLRYAFNELKQPRVRLVLIGFLTAPLAALLGSEDGVITRAVELLPFTVLLATFGVERLWSERAWPAPRALLIGVAGALLIVAVPYTLWSAMARGRLGVSAVSMLLLGGGLIVTTKIVDRVSIGRIAVCAVVALMSVQFAGFVHDYFTDYRLRSSIWLGGNLRGALETLIDMDRRDHPPRIYFSTLASTSGLMDIRNRWMSTYWRFYLIKHDRRDLLERTASLNPAQVHDVPAGSLVLANVGEMNAEALIRSGELKRVRTIQEVSGEPFFAILRR
jgi:4-amino-4-deoxy-L-arabinose transferase-like glycosyltransferase